MKPPSKNITLDDGVFLDVKTEDSGRLIGRQGQTLSDLQYLTNRMLFQQDQTSPKVLIDVGGYRAKAREALVQESAGRRGKSPALGGHCGNGADERV